MARPLGTPEAAEGRPGGRGTRPFRAHEPIGSPNTPGGNPTGDRAAVKEPEGPERSEACPCRAAGRPIMRSEVGSAGLLGASGQL
jgi:hypothetical protein